MPTDTLQIGTKVWLKPRPAFPFDPYGDYEGWDLGNAEWLFTALMPILGGQVAGLSGKVTAGQLTNNGDWRLYAQSILGKALTDHQTQTYNTRNIEKPYVGFNYVLLDEQFKYVPEGSGFVDAENNTTMQQPLTTGQMVVQKSGYLSVTTQVTTPSFNAYFDNLSILHRSGPLLQESDTYAFGGSIDALESRSFGRAENKYGYNGKEKQPDLGLEWMDYGARIYDAQVGRWHVQDILSDLYENTSCYAYVGNNPIFRKDIYGMDWYRVNVDGHYEYHFDPNLTANNAKDLLQKGQEYFSASGTITTYSKNADGTNGKILSQFDLNSDGSVLNKLSNKKLDAGTSTTTDFGSTINAFNDLPGTEQFLNGETFNSCDGNSYQLSNNEWIKLSGIMVDPMVYRSIGWSGGYNPPIKINQSTIVDNNVMVDALKRNLDNALGIERLAVGIVGDAVDNRKLALPRTRALVFGILYNIYSGAFKQLDANLKHDEEAIRLKKLNNAKQ